MRGFLAGEGFEGGREIGAGARAAQDMDDPCTRRGESPDVRDQHPRECLKIQNSKFKWNVALCAGAELTRSRWLAPWGRLTAPTRHGDSVLAGVSSPALAQDPAAFYAGKKVSKITINRGCAKEFLAALGAIYDLVTMDLVSSETKFFHIASRTELPRPGAGAPNASRTKATCRSWSETAMSAASLSDPAFCAP